MKKIGKIENIDLVALRELCDAFDEYNGSYPDYQYVGDALFDFYQFLKDIKKEV